MELLKALRLLGEPGRVRMLRLLAREELSVSDLQEILGMGQSRISMQLSPLKAANLIEARKAGQKSLYQISGSARSQNVIVEILAQSEREIPEARHDDAALELLLARKRDTLRGHFDELAGKFGRDYVPGRSWKALSEVLLRLLPPLEIADLGAGEGTLSLLLAQRAKRVFAIDNSPKMVEYGTSLALKNAVKNLEYRQGDMENLPLESDSVDLVLMHQTLHHALHPRQALAEAARILRPGGKIAILDLLAHSYEEAREYYGDVWMGFSSVQILEMLEEVGFEDLDVAVVDKENEAPHFQTLMAIATKPSSQNF